MIRFILLNRKKDGPNEPVIKEHWTLDIHGIGEIEELEAALRYRALAEGCHEYNEIIGTEIIDIN